MTKTALDVFDEVFPEVYAGPTWEAWRAFLAALFGLPACTQYADTIRACTGRQTLPTVPAREAWMVVGRRGGKSRLAAFLAVYCAAFKTYRLAAGERGVVMVLAADRKQARVIFRYIKALFDVVPMLVPLVATETADALTLTTGTVIEIHTASFRAVRGYTVVAAICDELAYWSTDDTAANPDTEILHALRPAMATVPGALLVVLSSPYARRGELWRTHAEHFGQDDDPILVWQAPSRTMNPALAAEVVADAYARDAAAARAEFGAEFRTDIESYISPAAVAACVQPGVVERGPVPGVRYTAFCDPAGGSGADAMTLAIGHPLLDDGSAVAVLDAVREVRPPFSPEATVQTFADTLRAYGITRVAGDRYAGDWPREAFRRHGITYDPADRPKGRLYADALPLLTSQRLDLLDDARLVAQIVGLERRTGRGHDVIDHPQRGHDDLANAALGLAASMVTYGFAPSAIRGLVW